MRLPPSISIQAERLVPGGRRWSVALQLGGERVPGVLLLPPADDEASAGERRDAPGPRRAPRRARRSARGVPGAVLLHGYASRKELMADTVGAALLQATGLAHRRAGRIAISLLIAQDLIAVIVLVVTSTPPNSLTAAGVGLPLIKAVVFVVVALALRSVVRVAGPEALDRHWTGTEQGLAAVKRLAGLPR